MALPIRTRPSFPHNQSFPSIRFHKPLILIPQEQTEWNYSHIKLIKQITWTTALSNSMKLWAMACRATQYGQVLVASSDKTWSNGEGNGKPLQYSCLENHMNRQKDMTLKDEFPRSVGAQYATGEKWRNNSERVKRQSQSKKCHPVVNVTGSGSKIWCWKEQYCIGTWNVRSMNQGKLEEVRQEMVRVNTGISGISELKCIRMGEFNSDKLRKASSLNNAKK